MVSTFRPIPHFIPVRPQSATHPVAHFSEAPSNEFLWFRLRQLSDVPEVGISLFTGTLSERRSKYRDFRALVRQARTYWDAGQKTAGSAAALPFYYGALQLAKAELLRSHSAQIQAGAINHGLRKVRSTTSSIRSDYLEVVAGVFPLLYEQRTGTAIPLGTRLKVLNLLSLIPEIGLEMGSLGPTRPQSSPGYYSVALSDTEAWSVVMFMNAPTGDVRERSTRLFLQAYEEVEISDFSTWRNVFAVSSRMYPTQVGLFQAKRARSVTLPNGTTSPDVNGAISELTDALGPHIRPSGRDRSDFILTPTIAKSKSLVLPLDLVRYASMFYLSSLVRYSPAALDPVEEGAQAYLMDSFVNEVPLELLTGAHDGISRKFSYFEPGNMRL